MTTNDIPPEDNQDQPQKKYAGAPIPVAEREILTRKIASLLLVDPNMPATKIASELGISRFQVKRITDSDFFKNLIETTAETTMQVAVNQARHSISQLLTQAVRTIKYHLDKNSLEAAKLVLKSTGIDQGEEKQQSDTNLTVVLPSGLQEKVIEVINVENKE